MAGTVKEMSLIKQVLLLKQLGESNRGIARAENGGYPPTQNGDIRSLFWLFSLMALQN